MECGVGICSLSMSLLIEITFLVSILLLGIFGFMEKKNTPQRNTNNKKLQEFNGKNTKTWIKIVVIGIA